MRWALGLAAAAALCAACGSDDGEPADDAGDGTADVVPDEATGEDGTADDSADDAIDDSDGGGSGLDVIGTIRVTEDLSTWDWDGTPTDYRSSQVSAAFYEGGPPRWHREWSPGGSCVLMAYIPSSCTPECVDGLCVDTDVCEPWPTLLSAGRLTVTGLATVLGIDPAGGYYYPSGALPENLFADDAAITATLAGADVPATVVASAGVAPLVVAELADGRLEIPFPAGADVTIRWIPAGDGSRIRLTLNANNQGHGMPYAAILECDADDDAGEVVVPAVLLDLFPATDAWEVCAGSDCPRSVIRRYRRGASPVGADTEIELVVSNQISFGLVHPRE